jgi:hypothetical protein
MSNAGEARESEAPMTSIRCEHDDELLALGAMRLLSPAEGAQLAGRLQNCPACRLRLDEYRALARALPRLTVNNAAASPTNAAPASSAINGTSVFPKQQANKNAENEQATDQETPEQRHPYQLRPGSRLLRQPRLMNVLSGLAAALLLAFLLAGFRWLLLGRGQGQAIQPSGCISRTHTGQVSTWQCGILVLDYTTKPETLIPLDTRTGKPLPGFRPLPVGNAVLSAITPDRRTLVLAIAPTQNNSAVYLQLVLLDQWKLGPQIKTGHYVDALTISDDSLHIYAVMPQYSNGTTTIWLQSYLYHPNATKGLQEGWRAMLPFLPNSDGFALSPDGTMLYAFSEKTSPAQIMRATLGENGLEQVQSLPLTQLASGADPTVNAAPYKKGDPVPSAYHPAVIFSPDRTMLYLVYAPQDNPTHDRLLTVYLAKWPATADQAINDERQSRARLTLTSAAPFSPLVRGASILQRATTATPLNERAERGVISPDGQWLYVTGESQTATLFPDSTWQEKTEYLGLWKINVYNGQIAGFWYQGDTFHDVHMSMGGQTLYLFRQPTDGTSIIQKPTSLLSFSTQAQHATLLFDLQFRGSIILTP